MATVTTVGITGGVPTSGTGTVSTLDNLIGTAGSASANVQTVQGIASGTAVTVADTALELAQNSTTSGQTGPLVQGATTTAAPTYTTGKTNPLSTTTAGDLRSYDATVAGLITASTITTGTKASPSNTVLTVTTNIRTPKGYQQITSLSGATALTVPSNSISCIIQAEAQRVRWRDDGVNPTSSVGTYMDPGNSMNYMGDLSAIRFIEVVSGGILNISYYG